MSNLEGKIIKDFLFVIKSKGKGHAGEVFKARLLKDREYGSKDDIVAIKKYNSWVLKQPNQSTRIDSELQSSINIESENVVKSFEIIHDNNDIFLVMEYISGETLTEFLKDNRELRFEKIIKISEKILKGLEKIHKKDLIHRDLKPDNIMIKDERVVIMDLGVIKDINATTTITSGEFLGTIKYASPEYLFGDPNYNEKIDLFSFGLILYELVFCDTLIKTEYWTKNIVEHFFYQDNGPDKYLEYFTEFPTRFDQKKKIFLWILLNGLLEQNDIRINLNEVLNALETQVWEDLKNWSLLEFKMVRYQKYPLILTNFIVMKDLETIINEKIPFLNKNRNKRFGFEVKKGRVISLYLGGKMINQLPESVGNLTYLENFYLVGNYFKNLPESLANLDSLIFLNLAGSKLESFPQNFSELSSLEYLLFDMREIKSFPKVITELTSLRELYIMGFISEMIIPECITNLKNLEKLILLNETIILPENFGELKSLVTLNISGDIREKIPNSLWNLENLIELDLSDTKMSNLPKEVSNLTSLKILKINNCPIDSIPNEIGNLKRLEVLEFNATEVKDLPDELLKLTNLKELYINYESLRNSSDIIEKLEAKNVEVKTFKMYT